MDFIFEKMKTVHWMDYIGDAMWTVTKINCNSLYFLTAIMIRYMALEQLCQLHRIGSGVVEKAKIVIKNHRTQSGIQ